MSNDSKTLRVALTPSRLTSGKCSETRVKPNSCDYAPVSKPKISLTYRVVMAVAAPIVRWWGRLEVVGEQFLPESGPTLLMFNHDSYWDPVVVGLAGLRRRQICALAKSSLWKHKPVAWVLDGMGQIPIVRGRGDTQAMDVAITALRDGACIGVFPEGTTSRGMVTRPHSGAGRLALAVPETHVVCGRVLGAVDIVRFPRRPRLRVEFFEPQGGQPQPGESAIGLTRRAMAEVRAEAPYVVYGRKKKAAQLMRAIEQARSD
jgi:1-acyl-sn-glycerol-3-phosphate acyltransferase